MIQTAWIIPVLCPQKTQVSATFPYTRGFETIGTLDGDTFTTIHGSVLPANKMTGWKL